MTRSESPAGAVGIVAINAHVPDGRVNLLDEMGRYEITEDFLRAKTGMLEVARKPPQQETSELAEQAVRGVLERFPDLAANLGLLVVVTQNPDGRGLPHTSAILHGRLGLGAQVAAFDLSLGCSGWVYGLSVAKSFMEANGMDHGLLVTADPYSKVLDPDDRNTSLLFGDAATATYLSRRDVEWEPGRFVFGTDGRRHADLEVRPDGRLFMNGRGIFTFSAQQVPASISATLERNGVGLEDVDQLILHQGSRYIVETIGQRLGVPEKTPFLAETVGNTVSSTIPLILSQGHCRASRRLLVAGFGVGLSWAACILNRRQS